MQLQPCHNYILIQLYEPVAPSGLVLPGEATRDASFGDEHRTKLEVLGVGKDVTCCTIGDFVLLRPNPNLLPVSKEPKQALVDANSVLAIVTSDSRPFQP